MKNLFLIWVLSFVFLCNMFAQKNIANLSYTSKSLTTVSSDNIKILAVMVEFMEDTDGATFGNGTFGSIYKKNYGNTIIDPLPHDKAYFENHLLFAKNYFQKVSNGKVSVNYLVLPDIIKVSKKMRDYSPLPKSNDFTSLADFSKEVWQKVVEQNPNLDFSSFNLFAIFHAGVGRDINLPGSLGNERDLPSVYLSQNQLKKIYGADFNGFPTPNSFITNTMILPETESREIASLTGDVLLELSINGLIVSSIASYLGLPDLFDTNTGLSAIGRFGLMDGQAIFAYGGLFPPEPSAWEKIYLGWETPAIISNSGIHNVVITAGLAAQLLDIKIAKVPINSDEYFLIENRQKDVNKNGITLTIYDNGSYYTKTFAKDTTGFNNAVVDSVNGVIVDVDEYDWALPGSGIVIWHIDESVIAKNELNKINIDKFHRGVDVEEADGIQDIGEQFTSIFGDVVVGEGEENDFWFLGNKSKLYKNRFSYDTKPDSRSYSGANSLVTISDFSENGNKMSIKITLGSENISLNYQSINLRDSTYAYNYNNTYYIVNSNNLYKYDGNNKILLNELFNGNVIVPAYNNKYLVGCYGSKVNIYDLIANNIQVIDLTENIYSSPIVTDSAIFVGTETGKIFKLLKSGINWVVGVHKTTTGKIMQINSSGNTVRLENKMIINNKTFTLPDLSYFYKFIEFNNSNSTYTVVLSSDNTFYIFKDGDLENKFKANSKYIIDNFSLIQLSNNNFYQIVYTSLNQVWAYNISGSVVDGFPLEFNDNKRLENYIFAADFDDDTYSDIMFFDEDGLIYLYSSEKRQMLYNLPLSVGRKIEGLPRLYLNNLSSIKSYVLDLNSSDKLYTINFYTNQTNYRLDYVGYFGSENNECLMIDNKTNNVISQYFPEERAYNWPNPVYGNSTFIRYYVKENSKINIKIFDLTGALVDELNANAIGGNDNEIEWNVSNIQSGVYLARIEAKGELGNSGVKIIKIAIIK